MGINDYFDKMYRTENVKKIQDITLEQTSPPTLTLVTLAEMKNYLKIGSDTTDDNLITDLIKSAHSIIENQIHKCIFTQSWKQMQQGGINRIKLLKCPVQDTPTVTIYEEWDSEGEVLTSDDFRIVGNELIHVNGWFDEYREMDGYVIEYDAGMFTSNDYSGDVVQGTATVGTASTEILAANLDRKYCILINYSGYDISLGIGSDAVVDSGIKITKSIDDYGIHNQYEFSEASGNNFTGAINAIASTTTTINYLYSNSYISTNDLERIVLKNVIYRIVAYLYENRQQYCTNYNEENWSINYDAINLPFEFKTMLAPLRQHNLGIL